MNNIFLGFIRTLVPAIVGQVVAWLLLLGIALDEETQSSLAKVLGVVLTGLYYLAVRLLAKRWPQIEVLLGLGTAAAPVAFVQPSGKVVAPVSGRHVATKRV